MAKKTPPRASPQVEPQVEDEAYSPEEREFLEVAQGEEKIDQEIAHILEKGEGDVRLMRWNPEGKKWRGLPSMPRMGFSRDLVAETWGGGKYLMTVYKGNAYKGGKQFEIDDAVRPKERPDAVSQGNGPDASLVVLVRGMLEELKAMRAQPVVQEKPLDVMALMKGIAETARSMVPPPQAIAPPPPQQPFSEQLKTATELVQLGKSIVGEPGEAPSSGDLYTAAILKAIDPVIEIVKERAKLERGVVPRAALPPAQPDTAAAPAAVPVQEAQVLPPWVMEVRRLLPIIVSRCKRNVDAANTAYFVLDDLSDAAKEKLAEYAQREDYEQQLMQFLPPDLARNPAWVQEFLNVVREYLLGGGEEEEGDERGGDEPPTAPGTAPGGAGAESPLADAARRSIDAIPA